MIPRDGQCSGSEIRVSLVGGAPAYRTRCSAAKGERLVEVDAAIEASRQRCSGLSATHLAAAFCDGAAMKALLDRGAPTHAAGYEGLDPAAWGRKYARLAAGRRGHLRRRRGAATTLLPAKTAEKAAQMD